MADDKNKSTKQTRQSSEDPAEGRRDVPSNSSQRNQRKYDVDKLPQTDYSSDDPTESRHDVVKGNRR